MPLRTGAATTHTRGMLLNLPLDALSRHDTIAWVHSRVATSAAKASTRSAATDSTGEPDAAAVVVTLNPEMVMAARRDAALRAILQRADLVVADGVGIVLAARLLGVPAADRAPGVDLVDALAADSASRGDRLFLLGAAPGVAQRAAAALEPRYSGLRIAGTYSGTPDSEGDASALQAIRAARPDVVFVAYGVPAQECWIARLRKELGAAGVAVAMGVGGALDILAGDVPRAPRWMRRAGLEWLYRLWREPWRWRRMLALPQFAALVAGAALMRQVRGRAAVETSRDGTQECH